jgi:beta-lactam-binding protein with PASTA domain
MPNQSIFAHRCKNLNKTLEKLKAFAKEFRLFLSSTIFLFNFAKMIAVLAGVFLLTSWWLKCYTNHGESVQVNDFTGMYVADAKKQGRSKDFRFEVIDSVWMEGKPSGLILSQDPKPLARVKVGRKIYVTVTGKPGPVRLPVWSQSSYDYDRYSNKLARLGIKSRVKERVFDNRQAENTILYLLYDGEKVKEQQVKKGFDVMMGSTLEFVVTERLSNEMEIPDLRCMTFDAAEFLVSTSNLNIGEVFEDETVTDRYPAYVYRQEPSFATGQTIQMGAQISVWLTQALPDGCRITNDPLDTGGGGF